MYGDSHPPATLTPDLIGTKGGPARQNMLENTQLVQDAIAYFNENNLSGMILFRYEDNAYPRVEWDFMSMVMSQMSIHVNFIKMVDIMYENTILKLKSTHMWGKDSTHQTACPR